MPIPAARTDYPEIRDAVRALVRGFGDAYFREKAAAKHERIQTRRQMEEKINEEWDCLHQSRVGIIHRLVFFPRKKSGLAEKNISKIR